MPVVTVTHDFDLPTDDLWELIGDFGAMGKWSGRPPEACVQDGEGIGALRTLTLDDGRKIVDRLEAEGPYFYSYSIVSSPLPFSAYRATMSVEPIDTRSSRFTWRGEFQPKGMTDEDGVAFTKGMYDMGIGLMQRTLAARTRN
ncbi:SRPBCC family protein [Phenylobacterium sp.]|uniref:SRPBCC family protein n=1 Tax=Phenylobacterium sp. TaxID=1871053 RepID=UPI00286E46F2|nr:SRPBCC family protein [Phenylobacterium sp.]